MLPYTPSPEPRSSHAQELFLENAGAQRSSYDRRQVLGRGTSGTEKLPGYKIWNKSSTRTVQVFTLHVPSLKVCGHLQSTGAKPQQKRMAWKPHAASRGLTCMALTATEPRFCWHHHTPSSPAIGPYRPGRLTKPARPQLLRRHQPSSLPDLIAGFHANPLRDGPVLLLLLGEEAFDLERDRKSVV